MSPTTKGPGEKRAVRQNGVLIERKAPKGHLGLGFHFKSSQSYFFY
jgi:hypothetical protein